MILHLESWQLHNNSLEIGLLQAAFMMQLTSCFLRQIDSFSPLILSQRIKIVIEWCLAETDAQLCVHNIATWSDKFV